MSNQSLPPIHDDRIRIIILSAAALFVFITAFIGYFIFLYQKKQLKNKQDRDEREAQYRQELLKTQIEIQEQTLENIAKEIHDNVTQVLSFIKLSLGSIGNSLDESKKAKMNESRELLSQTINDLRDLSKTMSFEHIKSLGLAKTIEKEVERMNKSDVINVHYASKGHKYSLDGQRELVLFRILQESLNNALKHSGAKNFYVDTHFKTEELILTLRDDGSGFSPSELDNKGGSGLRNIENRAKMIDGKAIIESSPGAGCTITIAVIASKVKQA
jgi:signal transduction histidine kinase